MAWEIRRAFRMDNPAGWIALGTIVLLTAAPVRRALRSATVAGAVGLLRLGDGLKDVGKRTNQETHNMVSEAIAKREALRAKEASQHWLRNAVVNGVASTMSAADAITEGAKNWFQQARSVATMEVGELGRDDRPAELLPEHLLPHTRHRNHQVQHDSQIPEDFAVKSSAALLSFRDDVRGVGAAFKPEYRDTVDVHSPDSEQ